MKITNALHDKVEEICKAIDMNYDSYNGITIKMDFIYHIIHNMDVMSYDFQARDYYFNCILSKQV